MNKPQHFFDVNYVGSDVIVDGFSVRSKSLDPYSYLTQICGLNNKYSVRSTEVIKQGQIVEESPFKVLHNLRLSKDPQEAMFQMESMFVLEDYSQFTKDNGPRLIVAGGKTPFYSHSFDPNAYAIFDNVAKIVQIKALKDIAPAHEITLFRYGSLHIMKNNEQIQKFYAERQKQLQENNVDTSKFRSMGSNEVKNIETVEVKTEETTQ